MHHYANIWAELSAWKAYDVGLSNTVGNQINWNVDDGKCDKMIDRQFKQWQGARNSACIKETVVCPNIFCYVLKSMYLFFKKTEHTLRA